VNEVIISGLLLVGMRLLFISTRNFGVIRFSSLML